MEIKITSAVWPEKEILEAARKDLINTLWPDPADKPATADKWDLATLITTARMRLEANRYYLERKTT